jgi:hypothetical protein
MDDVLLTRGGRLIRVLRFYRKITVAAHLCIARHISKSFKFHWISTGLERSREIHLALARSSLASSSFYSLSIGVVYIIRLPLDLHLRLLFHLPFRLHLLTEFVAVVRPGSLILLCIFDAPLLFSTNSDKQVGNGPNHGRLVACPRLSVCENPTRTWSFHLDHRGVLWF